MLCGISGSSVRLQSCKKASGVMTWPRVREKKPGKLEKYGICLIDPCFDFKNDYLFVLQIFSCLHIGISKIGMHNLSVPYQFFF